MSLLICDMFNVLFVESGYASPDQPILGYIQRCFQTLHIYSIELCTIQHFLFLYHPAKPGNGQGAEQHNNGRDWVRHKRSKNIVCKNIIKQACDEQGDGHNRRTNESKPYIPLGVDFMYFSTIDLPLGYSVAISIPKKESNRFPTEPIWVTTYING